MKMKVDIHNRIIWIILVVIVWYLLITEIVMELFFAFCSPYNDVMDHLQYMPDAMRFVEKYYLATVSGFVCILIYTAVTKRNRFIFKSFLPRHEGNKTSKLLIGFLVGFLMNFGCILCALMHGDMKLYLNFTVSAIPFFMWAFLWVFVQSSSEELWCRGFMYERIRVHYPLWVAIVVNGLFFAALHMGNPGASALPIIDIAVCGLSYSIAKWYTGSIWFPMGIHTTWNFTQNFLFGLPNSGLVSEVSIFGLDAASAHDSLAYNVAFGIEGALPAVIGDALLGIICIILAAKKGRLGELTQSIESINAGNGEMENETEIEITNEEQ